MLTTSARASPNLAADTPRASAIAMYVSRLAAFATALVVVVTVTIAAYVYCGAPMGLAAGATSVVALIGWIATAGRRPSGQPAAFNLYIGALLALMLLYSEQWYERFPTQLMQLYPNAFPSGVGIGDHSFVTVFPLVGAAISIFGALAYYQRLEIGRFAAWFVFAWGIIGAIAVYLYPLLAGAGFRYVGGMISAPLTLLLGVAGIRELLQSDGEASTTTLRDDGMPVTLTVERPNIGKTAQKTPLGTRTRVSIALVAVFIPSYATVLYLQAGAMVVGIVCGAMAAGFVVWLRTTLRRPPLTAAILPAYLLTLALFLLHVTEEYTEDFPGRIAAAAHVHWSTAQFVAIIVLFGPAIWIAGAIGIYQRHPLGNFIVWFFFIGMMLGEPAHVLVFPFMEPGRYHYFPGMWTSLLPMAPAVYGIWRMLTDDRAARRLREGGS